MLIIIISSVVLFAMGVWLIEKTSLEGIGVFSVAFGAIGLAFAFVSTPFSYVAHANDLGTIRGQAAVIKVYSDRINRLEERLGTFKYVEKPQISLDADSPVASIVKAISEAEMELAGAERVKAESQVDIEKRKAGPWSFIVSWKGEK